MHLFIFLIYFKGWERSVFHFKGQHSFGGVCVFVESANVDNRLKFVLKQETHNLSPALPHPQEQEM